MWSSKEQLIWTHIFACNISTQFDTIHVVLKHHWKINLYFWPLKYNTHRTSGKVCYLRNYMEIDLIPKDKNNNSNTKPCQTNQVIELEWLISSSITNCFEESGFDCQKEQFLIIFYLPYCRILKICELI
jgi:hypothetical protein